jgi:hypothetical protein
MKRRLRPPSISKIRATHEVAWEPLRLNAKRHQLHLLRSRAKHSKLNANLPPAWLTSRVSRRKPHRAA